MGGSWYVINLPTRAEGLLDDRGSMSVSVQTGMTHWHQVPGVGPWFYKEEVGTTESTHCGRPSALSRKSIALADSGDFLD